MNMRAFLLASAVAMPVLSQPAMAQSEEAQASNVSAREIIVTAQRRQQSLTSVPLTIEAATSEQLTNSGIRDLTDMQFATTGYMPETRAGNTNVFIRGIGNNLAGVADPSVAIFVDEVPRIASNSSNNLVDVERVEILKGAQGGLYGRNATGGVVNIITRKPSTSEVTGNLLASYGTKETLRLSGYMNLPISEKAAFSVTAERRSHAPYVKNIANTRPFTAANFPEGWANNDMDSQETADYFNSINSKKPRLNDENYWSLGSKLLLKPSENFEILLAADYANRNEGAGLGLAVQTPEFSQGILEQTFGLAYGIPVNLPSGFVQTPGKFEAISTGDLGFRMREYGVSATLKWEGEAVDLTSISAYRNLRSGIAVSGASLDALDVRATTNSPVRDYFYQEFRAVSTGDGPISWLGGVTYLKSQYSMLSEVFVLGVPTNPPAGRPFVSQTDFDQDLNNWSVYGEVSYDFTDKLTLTASGRYMREENETNFSLPVASGARIVQKKFVPAATLSYELDRGTIYARWAQGFKTGGINVVTAPYYFRDVDGIEHLNEGSIYKPEKVDTFEIGYRQALFDRRLNLTSAIFYNDYRDLQINTRGGGQYRNTITTAYVNANSARTYGAEASANLQVNSDLSLGANVTYLNAKFKDFKLVDSVLLSPFNLDGKRMTKSPTLQLSFSANYDRPISSDVRFVASGLVSHAGKTIMMHSNRPGTGPGTLPDAVAKAYWLANARIGLKTTDDQYGVALVADNVFNTAYYTSGNSSGSGNVLAWGNPRIIRAEVSMKF